MGWKTYSTLEGDDAKSHVKGHAYRVSMKNREQWSNPPHACLQSRALETFLGWSNALETYLIHYMEQSSTGEPLTILQVGVIFVENLFQFISVLELLRFSNTLLSNVSHVLVKDMRGLRLYPATKSAYQRAWVW